MGSNLTIDKHTTNLDDWLEIQSKLDTVGFDANITNHLFAWKFSYDRFHNCVNINPLQFASTVHTLTIQKQQCYVIGLVKQNNYEKATNISSLMKSIFSDILVNIQKQSYQICVKNGEIGNTQFFVYSYFGKDCKNKVKIVSLSYAIKLFNLMYSENRLKILTGGGVYKNKKLQMGSLLPITKNGTHEQSGIIQKFKNIHIVKELINFGEQHEQLNIFKYKPKLSLPMFHKKQPIEKKNLQIPSLKVGQKSIKPPMLKLALKPYEQVTYQQIAQEQNNGVMKFDIRATARHELKMEKFGSDCSKIIDGVYLSGEKVANNLQALKQHNITDIVNCAGDYCQNWFEKDKSFNYLTFFLKDSQYENIQCLFYRVIQFINVALRNKKNVLIHCIQGISRSVTFVIAYLIFMNGFDYKKAQNFVKERRGIACPNNGFMVQLIQFYKRLYENYDSLPTPRVFLVSSHCSETPDIITARMLKYKLFDKKKFLSFDSRAIYIIQCSDIIYLWVGNNCEEENRLKKYWAFSQGFIKKLQEHEKAPMKVKAISQNNEGRQFMALWGLEQLPQQYQNQQYNKLFPDKKQLPKPGHMRKLYENHEEIEQQVTTKLYIFPENNKGLGVFDLDDLTGFSLVVKNQQDKLQIFIWKSQNWNDDDTIEQNYIDKILRCNYQDYDQNNISIIEEEPENLSEDFLRCFS